VTAMGITGPGLTGAVRMTWVQDDLARVLDHSPVRRGAWTGRLDRPRLPDFELVDPPFVRQRPVLT
jgi:hypothetical protein